VDVGLDVVPHLSDGILGQGRDIKILLDPMRGLQGRRKPRKVCCRHEAYLAIWIMVCDRGRILALPARHCRWAALVALAALWWIGLQ